MDNMNIIKIENNKQANQSIALSLILPKYLTFLLRLRRYTNVFRPFLKSPQKSCFPTPDIRRISAGGWKGLIRVLTNEKQALLLANEMNLHLGICGITSATLAWESMIFALNQAKFTHFWRIRGGGEGGVTDPLLRIFPVIRKGCF